MAFSVNTRALAGLPPALDRRTKNLSDASAYVLAHTALRDGSGLANVLGVHRTVISGITGFLRDVSIAYPQSDSARMRAVITAYQQTDARAAARADAAVRDPLVVIPETPAITAAERHFGPAVFEDHRAPDAALLPPGDHYADMPYQPSWFDLLSPTSMARDVIWKFTEVAARFGLLDRAYDPFEMLVEPFVGDWAGLLRCAEVFLNVAKALTDGAVATLDSRNAMESVWTGHVATLADVTLSDFSLLQSSAGPPLGDTAAAYQQVAHGVQDNANLLEMIITTLIDQAFDTAMDAATLGIFDVYDAGVKVRDFTKTFLAAIKIAGHVVDLVSAGFTAAGDAVNRLGILRSTTPMPAVPTLAVQIPWPAPAIPKPRVPVPHI